MLNQVYVKNVFVRLINVRIVIAVKDYKENIKFVWRLSLDFM